MIRVELKKSLDSVDNGFSPGGRPNSKLKGGKQARESARWEKTEGEGGGSAKEDSETAMGRTPPSSYAQG